MRGEMKMSGRIYIVTGAAGFLGGTVCRQLLER
jgi:dihydroflavonol-4-reductase